MYMTEDEIFTDMLLYRLPESEKKVLIATPEEDLIMFHFGTGMWIRNHYKLWEKDNPHVVHNDSMHEKFPDQISQRIIERLWCHLTGKQRTFNVEVIDTTPVGADFRTYTISKVTRD